MERFKLIFLDHVPFVGGAQLALARHLNFLDLERFDPVVVSGDIGFFRQYLLTSKLGSVRLIGHHFGRLRGFNAVANFLRSSLFLWRLLLREKPSAIVINTERCLYVSLLGALVTKIPIIVFIRDFEFSREILTLLTGRVNHFICVSRSIRDYYFHSKRSKTSVVYVGTDLADRLRSVQDVDVARMKEKFGIKEEFLIGFVGRLVDWKGPLILVEIAALLSQETGLPPWRIVVIGDGTGQKGNIEGELEKRVEEEGLEKYFSLVGFSRDLPTWYKAFSVLLHTSREAEPFATVVVEALASALPVVATNLGGTREVIINARNGFLVDYQAGAFARAILRLMRAPNFYRQLCQMAQESGQRFQEWRVTREIEAIYLKVQTVKL